MIAGVTDTPALTHILGVVNVTDDSFSDGGQFVRQSDAVAHGLALASAGADIIDVGGQSTRPGAAPIRQKIEMQRVIPVIKELASHGINISVDTMRAEVAPPRSMPARTWSTMSRAAGPTRRWRHRSRSEVFLGF